jgi:predicted nucleic acid-binding protein
MNIPDNIWQQANELTVDIDPFDIPFVALSIYLDAYLWTGDKSLYNGLQGKGFNKSTFNLHNEGNVWIYP